MKSCLVPAYEPISASSLMNNCHSCHTLKYVTYLDLAKLGIDRTKIDGWRGDQPLDTPLTSLLSDKAATQSFNMVPPDLSLMTKAREGGAKEVPEGAFSRCSTRTPSS